MIRSVIAVIVVVLCFHDLGVFAPATPRAFSAPGLTALSKIKTSFTSFFTKTPVPNAGLHSMPPPQLNPALSNSALMQAQKLAVTRQGSSPVLGRTSTGGNANPNTGRGPGSHRSDASDMPLLPQQHQIQQAPRSSGLSGVSLNRVLGIAGVVLPAASIPAILVPTIMQSKENADRQKLDDARYQNDTAEGLRRYNEQRDEQMKQAEEQLKAQKDALVQSKEQFDESMAEQKKQSAQLMTQSQQLADPNAAATASTAPAPAPVAPAPVPVALSDRTFETSSQVSQVPPPSTGSAGASGIFW